MRAAIDGVGIAFMAEELTAGAVKRGKLEHLLPEWTASFLGFHLCYSNQRQVSPGMQALIETLCGQACASPGALT